MDYKLGALRRLDVALLATICDSIDYGRVTANLDPDFEAGGLPENERPTSDRDVSPVGDPTGPVPTYRSVTC